MSKFKVGDKVLIKGNHNYRAVIEGDKGIVTDYQKEHGCRVQLDRGDVLFFRWEWLKHDLPFTINSGDYIDSREFTREECERFCELAVECGHTEGNSAAQMDFDDGEVFDFIGVSSGGFLVYCHSNPSIMCKDITTQFREFLDKEKGMSKFTKDDLKDGMRVTDREGDTYYVTGQSIQQCWIGSKEHHKASLEAFESNLDFVGDDKGLDIIRVTDRDGTILFEREPELREVTLKLTQEQIDSLKEQGIC